ncbi:uncharacterized protein LOC120673344 isoform X2 [Panicum virgatum]|uniref:Uncharacterized protein n=1 Tax=Panicum virgatum TaxID=38727 RepID=A0A8T0RWJ6_PANVG|nr:uncharacterized protein LOC120673344 isoform X2 [Panicum virgatum]KAG2588893.1 hypothetical protein PVAP13_5NG293800 [Panicum virgatum]
MDQDVRDQVTLQQGSHGAAAREVVPVEVEEQGHRCPLPRGGRARVNTRMAALHKEEATVLAPDTLQGSQRTGVVESMALVETEDVATGKRRTRRSARSKMKMALDQKGAEEAAVLEEPKAYSSDVAIGSAIVSEKDCDDPKTHNMVVVVLEDFIKCQNVTKTHVVHEMEEVPAPALLLRNQRTAVPVEAEEVGVAKKGMRRSTRSKVAAAALKGQKDKSCDCPKEDEVVAVVEEQATKPLEGGNETRRTVAYKTDMLATATLQRGQRTSAPEAVVPVEAEEVATTKRRRAKSKVARAALYRKKDDSSDAVLIGSPVLVSDQTCDDSKEEKLVAVMEKQVTKPKEVIVEELEQRSTVHKSASMVKVEDPPNLSILPKVEATDIPDKTVRAETIKEDASTVTCEVDQSNLLVNTLSRFAKPMHKFTVKAEKKEGECWWMLM